MNFTKIMMMPVHSHADIDFVDIHVNSDTPLYIDPERIALSNHLFAMIAQELISSFFDTLCQAAAEEDYDRIYYLLSYGREPNETHLGLSEHKSQGRGTTPEILLPIIQDMVDLRLFETGLVTQLGDLQLWTPNFNYDRLSDLTTNIIRSALIEYTDYQYELWDLPSYATSQWSTIVWDKDSCEWVQANYPRFFADRNPILLVPKDFICKRMLSSPGDLLQKYALRYRQQEHLDEDSEYCHHRFNRKGEEIIDPPTKKELYDLEVKGRPAKAFLRQMGHERPYMVDEFHAGHRERSRLGNLTMSDWELDMLLYGAAASVEVG